MTGNEGWSAGESVNTMKLENGYQMHLEVLQMSQEMLQPANNLGIELSLDKTSGGEKKGR
jgi:protoporphyrinogen oxidase